MNKTSGTSKDTTDKLAQSIKRKNPQALLSAEEKIRIAPAGLRGGECDAALYDREDIAESPY